MTDSSGATVPGATVTLKCGSYRQSAQTAPDGTYNISAPAGSYQVVLEAQGFESVTQTVKLAAGATAPQNFTLKIGQVASIVSVTATGGFVAVASTTSTKTDTPLIETPQSVSVITEQQMAERGVQTVNQAIEYTAGVGVNTFGADSRFDYVNIRGFDQSTYGLFRDNSRWQSGQVSGQIDPYLIQEVDVIKGPASVLYGQNTPGGLINLVTKRPPAETQNEVIANLGAFDRKQFQEDLGGPLGANQQFRYRLTSIYRNSNTQVNHVPDDRWFVAPALTWAGHGTTLTLLADYQHDNTGWGQFLPSQGTLVSNPNGPIDTSFFAGEPGYDFFHRNQWSAGSLFEHRFGENMALRNTYRHSSVAYNGNDVFGAGLASDMRTLYRFAFGTSLHLGVDTTDTQFFVRAKTGGIEHSILAGLDYSHTQSWIVSGFAGAPSLDVYAPVYGATIGSLFTYYNIKQPINQTGLYFQDHMKIAKRLVVTLSGREDWTTVTSNNLLYSTTSKQTPNKFTGRAGITYLSDTGLSPYFSYSTSFLPNVGTTYSGTPFAPSEGRQIEGGVKYQPRHAHSFITASVFQIDETNVLTSDTAHQFNSVATGAIRSRGFELEAVASIAQGLNLRASYSYLDEVITKSNDTSGEISAVGMRPTQIPDKLFGITADYTLSRGALKGLGFGGGIRYVGASAGDEFNTIVVPNYSLVDVNLRYLWKYAEFQLNATNLGDKTYVAVCQSASYCNYGNRRNVTGSVRYFWNSWGKH